MCVTKQPIPGSAGLTESGSFAQRVGNTTDAGRWMFHTQPTKAHVDFGLNPTDGVGGSFIPDLDNNQMSSRKVDGLFASATS